MTTMFVVIFVEQWLKDSRHVSAILGIVLSVISLLFFGPDHFVIPAMMLMLLALLALRPRLSKVADKGSDVTLDHRNTKPHPVIFALILGLYRIFFHLRIKNFAEIICHTINFSNFVLGDHSDFCLYFFVFQHYKVTTNFANHQIYKHL